MSSQEPQRRQTILGEDGELREALPVPEQHEDSLYCTQCGTANRSSSRFCRRCGQSLDEQTLGDDFEGRIRRKSKHMMEGFPFSESMPSPSMPPMPQAVSLTAAMIALEIFTMIAVTGMVAILAIFGQAQFIPFLFGTWLLVVIMRNRSSRGPRRPRW